jgi:hypothetical protein
MITAFCDRNGVIEFAKGKKIPEGMLPIASGPARFIKQVIGVAARHAYDNKTLLVPGVPEAPTERKAGDALRAFCDWLKQRNHSQITVY